MDKKELVEKIESLPSLTSITSIRPYIDKKIVLGLVGQLDEPQKVKVPQFVAEFITEQKKLGHTLSYSIDASMSDRVAEWYWNNSELFAKAWIFGYEVEKEPKYTVKIPVVNQYLVRVKDENFLGFLSSKLRTYFTRKELEDAGFGWVFDCEGIELEEVTE
jgi:hypothetical protein